MTITTRRAVFSSVVLECAEEITGPGRLPYQVGGAEPVGFRGDIPSVRKAPIEQPHKR